jgi:hypothetical protein
MPSRRVCAAADGPATEMVEDRVDEIVVEESRRTAVTRGDNKTPSGLPAFPAAGRPRHQLVDLHLHLGDAMELQVQVMPDVVENAAALVQDFDDPIELSTRDSAVYTCRYSGKRPDPSRRA